MLKAWNTGHPGGIATVHANSAHAALYRIEQLVQESVTVIPRRLIAEAIDLVVFIAGRGLSRRLETIGELPRLDANGASPVTAVSFHQLQPFLSEEHTSEHQSQMRLPSAVFCLKQNIKKFTTTLRR